jgi:ADP-ribose pyrophosphatase
MFDGSKQTFEALKRPDVANVLPVLEGKIVLTQQEQPGTKPFIGAAGGRIDPGETPLQAAKRELREETGLEANQWFLWDAVNPFAKIDCALYTYIAKDCHRVGALDLDSGERIKLKRVSFDEFIRIVAQENYRDWEISMKVFRLIQNPEELQATKRLFHES